MTTKKTYENPYWSNKEARHLIVTIVRPDGKTKNTASIIDPAGNNPDMLAILEQYSEEDIDKNTQHLLDRRNDDLRKQMERRESQNVRAKQEGLFACKLEAFEIDAIKNSKNTEMKKMIRKAKTPMEVNAYATILLMTDLGLVKNVE